MEVDLQAKSLFLWYLCLFPLSLSLERCLPSSLHKSPHLFSQFLRSASGFLTSRRLGLPNRVLSGQANWHSSYSSLGQSRRVGSSLPTSIALPSLLPCFPRELHKEAEYSGTTKKKKQRTAKALCSRGWETLASRRKKFVLHHIRTSKDTGLQ